MSAPTPSAEPAAPTPAPASAPPPVPPAPSPTPSPETPAAPTPPAHWTEALDADLRQEPTLGRYKTVNDFAKGFLEQRAKLSQKGVIIPPENAKPEAWAEVRKALGVPDAPEGYDLNGFERPETGWDGEFEKRALTAFHAAGASPKLVRDVLGWYAAEAKQEVERLQQQEQQVTQGWAEETRRKWGGAVDAKLDLAERTFDTYFPGQVGDIISEARLPGGGTLSDHPAFLDAMAQIGQVLAEHQLLGDKEPTRFARSPDEATAEIARLKADPEFGKKLFDKKHPEHAEADATWLRLHEQQRGAR